MRRDRPAGRLEKLLLALFSFFCSASLSSRGPLVPEASHPPGYQAASLTILQVKKKE